MSDWYADDPGFQGLLARLLPREIEERATPLLAELGQSAATELAALADAAEANPPVLERFDRDGGRIESVRHHPAYDALRRGSYGFGLLTRFHGPARAEWGGWPATVKFALGYLFAQAEQGLYCPICLTDGTATLLERYAPPELQRRYLPGLTSNRADELLEGAMFLTEKAGGSDVGATETTAEQAPDGSWRIHGEKWFCSNAGAQVMMVLARPHGAAEGTRGLGLFVVPRHLPDGAINGFRLERLKDKLGTRSMATGEILFEGAHALLLGEPGAGFAQMTDMLNLSRLYNAVASAALMRRALREGLQHARSRSAFGRQIVEYPMVRRSLVETAVSLAACLELVFSAVRLYDVVHHQPDPSADERQRLRLLTPLVKYWTAIEAVRAARRMLELVGGNGYVETFPLARLLRDAQVLTIWEGTTNILVLDAFRAIGKGGAAPLLQACDGDWRLLRSAARLGDALQAVGDLPEDERSGCLEQLSDRMVELFAASRLVAAAAGGGPRERVVAELFLEQRVYPAPPEQRLERAPASGRREVFEAVFAE